MVHQSPGTRSEKRRSGEAEKRERERERENSKRELTSIPHAQQEKGRGMRTVRGHKHDNDHNRDHDQTLRPKTII